METVAEQSGECMPWSGQATALNTGICSSACPIFISSHCALPSPLKPVLKEELDCPVPPVTQA